MRACAHTRANVGDYMKKKIVAFLLIMILVVASLSGCTFVRLNADRQSRTVLRTISKDGVSLDITYMELTDYVYNLLFGSNYYYYYIAQGQATLDDVVDLAVSWKTQTKALTISAMQYLASVEARQNALIDGTQKYDEITAIYGKDYLNKQVMSYLTIAEYYDAIKSVNDTIDSVYEGYVEEIADQDRNDVIRDTNLQDVKSAVIIEGVKDEYYVGESGPRAKDIKLRLTYNNGETVDIPVTTAMIKTEFSSTEAGEFDFNVNIDVEVKEGDQYVATTLTATKAYEVATAPATKASTDEKDPYMDIIRYMSAEQIATWANTAEGKSYEYTVPTVIDVEGNYKNASDATAKKAWEKTIEYFNDANRSVDYYYESAFESSILEAYKAEVYNAVESEYTGASQAVFEAEIANKILELGNIDKEAFDKLSEAEKKSAFIKAIEDVLSALYYVPSIDKQAGYFYVSHMLLQFNEDKYSSIVTNEPSQEAIADYIYSTTVDELNPRYEVAFVCDGWEYVNGERVHNADKCSDKNTDGLLNTAKTNCKSIDYTRKDVQATEVLSSLANALDGKTGNDAVKIFNEYVEKYGMDSGILSKTNGYLMTPDEADMSWVDGFESLGILLGASADYTNNGTYLIDEATAKSALNDLYYGGQDAAAAEAKYNEYMKDVFEYTSDTGKKLYYCVGKTLSSSSGTISGYAGIHVMMVTFCPFGSGSWGGSSIINLDGDQLQKAVSDNILETKQSTEYSAITNWLSDYTVEDNGYGWTLGEGYEGYTITDHNKLNDYIQKLMESYGA